MRSWDEISLRKVDLGAKNTSKSITGRQVAGFHVLDSLWMTSRACAVAFKSPRPLPVGRHRPIRRHYLR